jgi:hypothetical protein
MPRTHGRSLTAEYRAWKALFPRCYYPSNSQFRNYGGRGIRVCQRWHSSDAFLADMGERPSPAHSLDRIDNDLGYLCGKPECPDCGPAGRIPNCRWVTQPEQRRNCRTNRRLTLNGVTRCITDWAAEAGISVTALRGRLDRGWPLERAMTEPAAVIDRPLTFQGRTLSLSAWAAELGFTVQALCYRLDHGWSVERTLTTPRRNYRSR